MIFSSSNANDSTNVYENHEMSEEVLSSFIFENEIELISSNICKINDIKTKLQYILVLL